MRSLFRRFLGMMGPSRSNVPAVRPLRHRLELEYLEARVVPSIASTDFRLSTITSNNQFEVVNASSNNGLSVAVWTHNYSSTDKDIKAQMYNANGSKRGGEITVANSARNESAPAVAMDNLGGWKVVWVQDTTSANKDVLGSRYSSSGAKLGPTITVAGTSKSEYDPSVAANAVGDFVVSYTLDYSSTDQDIRARRYTNGGLFQQEIAVATSGASDETHSAVARSGGSNAVFAIAYQVGTDITLKRYSATGSLVNTHLIATGSNSQVLPSVTMDDIGRTVVTWQELVAGDFGIFARKVDNAGIMGSRITIRDTSSNETNATVALDRNDGDFVVAYQVGSAVYVCEMNSNGTPKTTAPISLGNRSSSAYPSISIAGNDNYFLTYTDINRSGDPGLGVYGRFGHLS